MHAQTPLHVAVPTEEVHAGGRARAYLGAFVGGAFAFIALLFATLFVLRAVDRLSPPPVSGTWCIDSRFAWLKQMPQWKQASFTAVGSSTTWRNLDFSVAPAEAKRDGIVNVAPCFLTINQTRYMAEYLLDRAPTTKTMLTVLTVRDLEGCSRNKTAFFDADVADRYIDGVGYKWWLYFRNFRVNDIFLHALYAGERAPLMQFDRFGSGPLTKDKPDIGNAIAPEQGCYAELRKLATFLKSRGVQFIVATFPLMQGWVQRYDSDGRVRANFRAGVDSALASTDAIVVDGMTGWEVPDSAFTDPVHLQWRETAAFTRFVWSAARHRGALLPALQSDKALDPRPGILPERAALPAFRAPGFNDKGISAASLTIPVNATDQYDPSTNLLFQQNANGPSPREIRTESPLVDAIIQNTRGYSEGYPLGVPKNYTWCGGSYQPNAAPPDDFTAVMGWGQVYPKLGANPPTEPSGTVEIARGKTYLRLTSSKQWILVQDQPKLSFAGAYFVADFSRKPNIPIPMNQSPIGSVIIDPPPSGYNAHFWFTARGRYAAGEVDGVYVQMDMRTTGLERNLIANVGADWWRDTTAKFAPGFVNNPGAGMSNWVELSTEWSTLRFFSLNSPELQAAPPPPLIQLSHAAMPQVITRRVSTVPSPCLKRHHPELLRHPAPRTGRSPAVKNAANPAPILPPFAATPSTADVHRIRPPG